MCALLLQLALVIKQPYLFFTNTFSKNKFSDFSARVHRLFYVRAFQPKHVLGNLPAMLFWQRTHGAQ